MTDPEKQLAALQKELNETRLELEKVDRDLKRTQAQLVHREKLASLGELTAGITHEIKNPLNFINNFAEINVELLGELGEALASGEDLQAIIDDMTQNAARIVEHGRRATEIVRSMMQHASASRGLREHTDLNALVSEHLALAFKSRQAHMPDLDVKIEQDLSRRIGKVELVPQDIGWVVLNLINNALDALEESGASKGGAYRPVIRVSTNLKDDHVEIRVSDNGPGIASDVKDRIFEPFFTTKPAASGTGLGLSFSYDIVTKGHGGSLTVESEEGRGATFVVALPRG